MQGQRWHGSGPAAVQLGRARAAARRRAPRTNLTCPAPAPPPQVLVGALAAAAAVATCFLFSKDLVLFLEAPVAAQGVRFLQLSPGEFFFTTLKVGGYAGILVSVPTLLYEIAAYVVPGLTKSERQFLAPVILGSSVLFYAGCGAVLGGGAGRG